MRVTSECEYWKLTSVELVCPTAPWPLELFSQTTCTANGYQVQGPRRSLLPAPFFAASEKAAWPDLHSKAG